MRRNWFAGPVRPSSTTRVRTQQRRRAAAARPARAARRTGHRRHRRGHVRGGSHGVLRATVGGCDDRARLGARSSRPRGVGGWNGVRRAVAGPDHRRSAGDLVVLDAPPPTPLHAGNVAGHWIFGLSAAAVRDVLVDGRLVLTGRRPAVVDTGDVAELTRGAARRLATASNPSLSTRSTHWPSCAGRTEVTRWPT